MAEIFIDNKYVSMSRKILDRIMRMSVEEIIAENNDSRTHNLYEGIGRPLTAHETALLFQSEGTLTVDEMDTLMYNKIREIWRDENSGK